MKDARTILQIVPRPPGSREGVGDYASKLAAGLARSHGYETEFVTGATIFNRQWRPPPATAVVLHYVNYGYNPRGVPSWLPRRLSEIQQRCGGRIITIFHELYASSSWRRSAFWLQPLQQRITRALAQRSAVCIVSSAVLAEQLRRLAPAAPVLVRPVPSNFGEPTLSAAQVNQRNPQRWVICGGAELIKRSLRSFTEAGELFVVGGADLPEIRQSLDEAHYWPNVEATVASGILGSCAFGWIDYFERADVPTAAILKSSAFAAYCAHGVVPVFPSAGSAIALGDDALPGPFFPGNLPAESERPAIAQGIYDWYGRNASSAHLAESIASVIAP